MDSWLSQDDRAAQAALTRAADAVKADPAGRDAPRDDLESVEPAAAVIAGTARPADRTVAAAPEDPTGEVARVAVTADPIVAVVPAPRDRPVPADEDVRAASAVSASPSASAPSTSRRTTVLPSRTTSVPRISTAQRGSSCRAFRRSFRIASPVTS